MDKTHHDSREIIHLAIQMIEFAIRQSAVNRDTGLDTFIRNDLRKIHRRAVQEGVHQWPTNLADARAILQDALRMCTEPLAALKYQKDEDGDYKQTYDGDPIPAKGRLGSFKPAPPSLGYALTRLSSFLQTHEC